MSRYDLTDFEWRVIEPLLPNKPRGVPRVDDRRVLNGIFWVLRSGAPWRDLPERYGPRTTCYNRFARLVALVVLAVLVVAGIVLVDRLSSVSALQDCLMTRATNCASISPPPSAAPAGRSDAPSTTR